MTPTRMLYKVTIDAVDGERFFCAGGPERAELLAFLIAHDHEGSSITLDWCDVGDNDNQPGLSADPDRIYRILKGDESAPHRYRPDHNGECVICDEPANAAWHTTITPPTTSAPAGPATPQASDVPSSDPPRQS